MMSGSGSSRSSLERMSSHSRAGRHSSSPFSATMTALLKRDGQHRLRGSASSLRMDRTASSSADRMHLRSSSSSNSSQQHKQYHKHQKQEWRQQPVIDFSSACPEEGAGLPSSRSRTEMLAMQQQGQGRGEQGRGEHGGRASVDQEAPEPQEHGEQQGRQPRRSRRPRRTSRQHAQLSSDSLDTLAARGPHPLDKNTSESQMHELSSSARDLDVAPVPNSASLRLRLMLGQKEYQV